MDEPTRLKHYEILSRIGEGGMGVVYRARDTRLGRTVALKTLHRELSQDEERSRRFEREARIVSSMSHPGIATVYDFDHDGPTTFLTMELIEGPTLRQLLRDGPLPVAEILDCAVQVAEALAAAHRIGVVHRDLKPENIMRTAAGYYKVLDFGVARIHELTRHRQERSTQLDTLSWATSAGGLVGTVAYMSPEQALAEPLDARSDIFSFGSLLYELCSGRPAFRGNNAIATAEAIANRDPQPLRRSRPELPRPLERIVSMCLAKRREERYPTADALLEDLRRLQMAQLTGSSKPLRLLAQRDATRRGVRRSVLVGAAAAVGLIAIAVWGLVGSGPRAPTDDVPAPSPTVPRALRPGAAMPAVARSERPRVVVAAFENRSGESEADGLTAALPEMLTTDLARSDDLEVIATQRLHDLASMVATDTNRPLAGGSATEIARWAGANIVISGSVFKLGATYRIDAQAYDTASGTVLVARKVEGTDLFDMVNRLTSAMREGLRLATEPSQRLETVTTGSKEAFRRYAAGQQAFDNLRYATAAEQFRAALELDPDFALAKFRLALSLFAGGEERAAVALARELQAQIDRLPEADRLLAMAFEACFDRHDLDHGTRYLQELSARFPGHAGVAVLWARALSELAGDHLAAVRKLRSAVEQDPNDLPAIAALADQLARFGQQAAARGLLEEAASRNPQAADALRRRIDSYAAKDASPS